MLAAAVVSGSRCAESGEAGVVVDMRNNNGGYINGYALDVFTRQNYLR